MSLTVVVVWGRGGGLACFVESLSQIKTSSYYVYLHVFSFYWFLLAFIEKKILKLGIKVNGVTFPSSAFHKVCPTPPPPSPTPHPPPSNTTTFAE